jgi:hypothetical protein
MLEVRRSDEGLELELTGEWRALKFGAIDAALAGLDLAGAHRIEISTTRLEVLDLSGAWRLHEFIREVQATGTQIAFKGAPPDQLRLVDQTLKGQSPECSQRHPRVPLSLLDEVEVPALRSLTLLGRHAVLYGRDGNACGRSPSQDMCTTPGSPRFRSCL